MAGARRGRPDRRSDDWRDVYSFLAGLFRRQCRHCLDTPAPHDLLFSNGIPENDYAYFYAIVARVDREWWPYYIGMTYKQTAAVRHRQADHVQRLARLRANHPGVTFSLCLGVPTFQVGRDDPGTIREIESLLIYANWHEDMVNDSGINNCRPGRQIYVHNSGWTDHLYKEVSCGVFYRR